MVVQFEGAGVLTTLQVVGSARQLATSVGPCEIVVAFQPLPVTTPLEKRAIRPPSPTFVLLYSSAVFGSP